LPNGFGLSAVGPATTWCAISSIILRAAGLASVALTIARQASDSWAAVIVGMVVACESER